MTTIFEKFVERFGQETAEACYEGSHSESEDDDCQESKFWKHGPKRMPIDCPCGQDCAQVITGKGPAQLQRGSNEGNTRHQCWEDSERVPDVCPECVWNTIEIFIFG